MVSDMAPPLPMLRTIATVFKMISSCTYYLILYFYPYSALYHLYCVVLLCFVDNNNNNNNNNNN